MPLLPSRRGLRAELLEHAHSAMGYTMALGWTHLFLPMFGEEDLFQRSAAELMQVHVPWARIAYIWVYTAFVTSLCWWLYITAERRSTSGNDQLTGSLADHVSKATWGTLATSLVYVTVWAWICALLSVLPTGNPFLAFLSGVFITVIAAGSVIVGQRGFGPFLLLRGDKPERVKTVVFFTTIMTAMMWVGAFDYAISYAWPAIPPWACAWSVAVFLCVVRWIFLWLVVTDNTSSHFVAAMQSYPSTPDLALSVGLVAPRVRESEGKTSPVPSLQELHTASVGLGSLVFAWGGSVALQGASTVTWKTWPWPYNGPQSVAPSTGYALAITAVGVVAVATARAMAEDEKTAHQRLAALASETSALGVASGWSWYHALESIFPALCDSSALTRFIGTMAITAFGVMVMLALKPPAGTPYSNANSPQPPDKVFATAAAPWDAPLPPVRGFMAIRRNSVGSAHSSIGFGGEGEPGDRDCSPTSTHYRAFVDMRRNHSADWLPPSTTAQSAEEEAAAAAAVEVAAAASLEQAMRQQPLPPPDQQRIGMPRPPPATAQRLPVLTTGAPSSDTSSAAERPDVAASDALR